jgi:hypothetical protein
MSNFYILEGYNHELGWFPPIGLGALKGLALPKIALPRIALPQIGGLPRVNLPRVNLPAPRIPLPKLKIQAPRIPLPKLKIQAPKINLPKIKNPLQKYFESKPKTDNSDFLDLLQQQDPSYNTSEDIDYSQFEQLETNQMTQQVEPDRIYTREELYELGFKLPKINFKAPKINFKAPKINLGKKPIIKIGGKNFFKMSNTSKAALGIGAAAVATAFSGGAASPALAAATAGAGTLAAGAGALLSSPMVAGGLTVVGAGLQLSQAAAAGNVGAGIQAAGALASGLGVPSSLVTQGQDIATGLKSDYDFLSSLTPTQPASKPSFSFTDLFSPGPSASTATGTKLKSNTTNSTRDFIDDLTKDKDSSILPLLGIGLIAFLAFKGKK